MINFAFTLGRILAAIRVWGPILLLGSALSYVGYLKYSNVSLSNQRTELQMALEASQEAVETLSKDRAIIEGVLATRAQKAAQDELERTKLQNELRRLRRESDDTCLDSSIPVDILDRL